MKWLTWDQAALAALVSGVLALILRRVPPTRFVAAVIPAVHEFTFVASLYSVWRLARQLPLAQTAGAIERARQINQLEQNLFFPTELSLQRFVLNHDWLARMTNFYYAVAHVPALLLFLVWLFIRHRDAYPRRRKDAVSLSGLLVPIPSRESAKSSAV